jgi:hypothetical protein
MLKNREPNRSKTGAISKTGSDTGRTLRNPEQTREQNRRTRSESGVISNAGADRE